MALSEDLMSKCSEHLSGYKSACEAHPELKSFDSSLQQRTIKVIDKVTAGAEAGTGFVSLHEIHMEVTKHLVEVSQDVANVILESEVDVWENIPLRSLVKAYFENTKKTLEIFDNVMECVEKAELGQQVLLVAVAQFDKESAEKDRGGKKKYEKTLKELKKFKAMEDPFNGRELVTQFKLLIEQQESLLKDVSEAKKRLEEEQEKVAADIAYEEKWSFWSNLIFGAGAFIAGVASIALIATGVGAPLGIAVAGGLFIGILPGWVGVYTHFQNRIDALKKQQEALKNLNDKLTLVEKGAITNKQALEAVSELEDGLEKKILSIMKYVDDAIDSDGDEVKMKLDLERIREKVEKLTEKIKELGESVDKYSKLIREARFHVLEKINGSGKYHHV